MAGGKKGFREKVSQVFGERYVMHCNLFLGELVMKMVRIYVNKHPIQCFDSM